MPHHAAVDRFMDPSLHDLIARLDQLSDSFAELREGVRKAVLVADLDPEMALTRARKVLEYVIRDVFERRIKEPPGTRPLENLLQRLVKEGFFPDRLDAYANTVRKLGNVGTHNFGERVTAGDVYQSLTQLMPILEWYFEVERPDAGVRLSAPREREPGPEELARAPIEVRAPPRIAVVPKGLRSFDAGDSGFFLSLLPGPRDHDGLPESLRFWKYKIEETREPTFAVGVIYGPSGCGKSSLVKAGLLPRLAREIVSVYIEATALETEAQLKAGLRKRIPALPADLDLAQTLAAIRQGQGLNSGQRVLIVLDQFEQWLHAHRGDVDTTLARALRQCDGENLRCVLMVRDDFWMALTRFLGDLHVELIQGQNAAAVDLFDTIHARTVLTAFGRAFGRLPASAQDAFLDRAVAGLAQDGRVISIRLALFAEMIKGKPWTPATLAEAGGMDRIGVHFLDETFRTPALRASEKPAQAVLRALLPERGSEIKGHMRSHEELRAAAGATVPAQAFDTLLRTLDRDVRLITPTDPGGRATTEGERPAAAAGQYYQLTHDFLVPSLRDWLRRKQRETRQGRAELRLAERAALWRDRPENRFLPSPGEWCRIRLFTRPKDWTEHERRMMRTAARVHGLRALGLLAVGAALVVSGLAIRRRVDEDRQKTHAAGLVHRLLDADTEGVPAIIEDMKDYRRWVDPELRQRLPQLRDSSRQKLHASLALLPADPGQVDFLDARLPVAGPAELPVLRDALQPHQRALIPRLWPVLEAVGPDDPRVLPAASALAAYDPAGVRWSAVGAKVASALAAVNPVYLRAWMSALLPVSAALTAPLATIFRDADRRESERTQAANILAGYAADDPGMLADLLMDASPQPFAVLFPSAQARSAEAVPTFRAELSKTASGDEGRLAQRQARAALALLRLGKAEAVWSLLQHSPDPSARSYIVHWLKPLGADPEVLVAKLGSLARETVLPAPAEGLSPMDAILFDKVTSLRRALILALGEFAGDLPAGKRDELAASLLDAYRNDPDAGIHGAAEWALRQWHQDEALKKACAALPRPEDRGDRRWYVNSEGQTLAVIVGPYEFEMGSPANEPIRELGEQEQHHQRIDWTSAIATKEVTREQYERFVQANRANQKHDSILCAAYSPDRQGPQVGVCFYDAAAYCNWLSEKEHLEPCYLPNDQGEYAEGMKLAPHVLERSGYRLPYEEEWEYVCRAGAATSCYFGGFGGPLDLQGKYFWSLENSPKVQAAPCARLKPNDLGFFDLIGNAAEWCLNKLGDQAPAGQAVSLPITDSETRFIRGGSYYRPAGVLRSAFRGGLEPSKQNQNNGLRLARTFH
jgi:formylglycine-generating enzyme required for sulfatase activity